MKCKNFKMRSIYMLIISIIILSIFSTMVISAGSVKKICPFTPDVIKCTPIVCENGKFTRVCVDITSCWNDGREFERKGSCQSDYVAEDKQSEEEKQVQQFFNYEDDLPSINEDDLELISADLISGDSFVPSNIIKNKIQIPEDYETEKIVWLPYAIAFLVFMFLLFMFIKKRRSKFGGFASEIGKLK